MKKMILIASIVTSFAMITEAANIRCEVEEQQSGKSDKEYTVEVDTNDFSAPSNPRVVAATSKYFVALNIDKLTKEMSIIFTEVNRKATFEAVGSNSKVKAFWMGPSPENALLWAQCELVK